jgi:hypothetical protein
MVIELQARFDEEANIYRSRKLEEVGANIFWDTRPESSCSVSPPGRKKKLVYYLV